MAKKNKKANSAKRFENVEYIISQEMQDLINAFKKCGYKVEVASYRQFCGNGRFDYYRYCTEITIDELDGECEPYTFIFTPNGERASYGYDPTFCEKIKLNGE